MTFNSRGAFTNIQVLEFSSVQRLARIMMSRYGAELQVELMSGSVNEEKAPPSTLLNEGTLRIPITYNIGHTAVISFVQMPELSEEDQSTITFLTELLLKPALEELRDQWNGQATHARPSTESEIADVIALFHDQALEFSEEGEFSSHAVIREAKSFLTPVIFLSTRNLQSLPRITSEIHSLSRRLASLPFLQVADQLQSVMDIWTLGSTTLVVEDFSQLSPGQIELIGQYLSLIRHEKIESAQLNDFPLFLISCSEPPSVLVERGQISAELGRLIQACVLEVNRLPANTKLLREALELFLEPGTVL